MSYSPPALFLSVEHHRLIAAEQDRKLRKLTQFTLERVNHVSFDRLNAASARP